MKTKSTLTHPKTLIKSYYPLIIQKKSPFVPAVFLYPHAKWWNSIHQPNMLVLQPAYLILAEISNGISYSGRGACQDIWWDDNYEADHKSSSKLIKFNIKSNMKAKDSNGHFCFCFRTRPVDEPVRMFRDTWQLDLLPKGI